MRLRLNEWDVDDVRYSMCHRFNVKLHDSDNSTIKWYTKEEIERIVEANSLKDTEEYKTFNKKLKIAEQLLKDRHREGFTKHFPKLYLRDDKYVGEEIYYVENHSDGDIAGPYYLQVALMEDFDFKDGGWAIRKEVLNDLKNYDIDELCVCDSHANRYFYTTVRKYKTYGVESEGKVYLALRYFEIHEHREYETVKPAKYDKYLKGLRIYDEL